MTEIILIFDLRNYFGLHISFDQKMKELVIVFLSIFFACTEILAQELTSFDSKFEQKNSIQFEALGAGIFYSIGYERVIFNGNRFKTLAQVSFSIAPYYSLSIPLALTEIISFNQHHIEIGLGYNLIPEWTLSGRIGYRYQKAEW